MHPPDTFDPVLYKYARNVFASAQNPVAYGAADRLAVTEGPLHRKGEERKRDKEKGGYG